MAEMEMTLNYFGLFRVNIDYGRARPKHRISPNVVWQSITEISISICSEEKSLSPAEKNVNERGAPVLKFRHFDQGRWREGMITICLNNICRV